MRSATGWLSSVTAVAMSACGGGSGDGGGADATAADATAADASIADPDGAPPTVDAGADAPLPPILPLGTPTSVPIGANPNRLALADFNQDGRLDLAVHNFDQPTVSIYLNTTAPGAAPSFATPVTLTRHQQTNTFGDIAVVDLDGDDNVDVAATTMEPSAPLAIFVNTTPPGGATASFAARLDLALPATAWGLAAGELDGDDQIDLVVGAFIPPDGELTVLRNTTPGPGMTPTFAAPVRLPAVIANTVRLADVNGDARLDLTGCTGGEEAGAATIYVNQTAAAGALVFGPRLDVPSGAWAQFHEVVDLDADGKADLVTSQFFANQLWVRRNLTVTGAATASFADEMTYLVLPSPNAGAGDVDRDGKPDLLAANANSNPRSVSVLINRSSPGTLTFAPRVDLPTGENGNPFVALVADLDDDGKDDLLVGQSGALVVFPGT